jgi:hypothetical protein
MVREAFFTFTHQDTVVGRGGGGRRHVARGRRSRSWICPSISSCCRGCTPQPPLLPLPRPLHAQTSLALRVYPAAAAATARLRAAVVVVTVVFAGGGSRNRLSIAFFRELCGSVWLVVHVERVEPAGPRRGDECEHRLELALALLQEEPRPLDVRLAAVLPELLAHLGCKVLELRKKKKRNRNVTPGAGVSVVAVNSNTSY